jgi:indolepyruvate ferredoxin oxidoreductase beta subunit
MSSRPTNIVIAGLGGQGVIKASDILADVAFSAGLDVKKSELHGMSQRGGSVSSDVRFGERVFSPMVPEGEADFLVVIAPDQVAVNAAALKPGGILIELSLIDEAKLSNKKSVNVALLGVLSSHLPFSAEAWIAALRRNLPEKLYEANLAAFYLGRDSGQTGG